ncbi:DnaD domain protein [Candidatus Clostridium radicumherbarum]|uniref:DnaD domain protein n=1 Tax=Candidatus Clostridium radicumherbarum TaxID=3381662 RepID=A0ABW8TW37_9CLOT
MAQRRMFSLRIVDTDLFLDMPISTQLLYFHLAMRADDDGFVSNPKKIMRLINCSDDDMKILILKKFIIPFESGVCVIKDWKVHNNIQKDRYRKTQYHNEMSTLKLDENGSYQICIQDEYNLDTQVRLGKDRLDFNEEETTLMVEVDDDTIMNYRDCISKKVSDKELEILANIQKSVGKDILNKAIIIAAMKNAKNLDYIVTIVNDWSEKGLKTIEQVNLYLSKWVTINRKAKESRIKQIKERSEYKSYGNKGTFNNFEQRTYDFDKLEKQLLGWE